MNRGRICVILKVMEKKTVVLSLGGFLLVPNGGIDTDFLKKFRRFILREISQGRRFFIVVGGGTTSRLYQTAGKKVVGGLTKKDMDWIGIYSTHLNSHLLRIIFSDVAYPKIIDDYEKLEKNIKEPIVLGAGGKPGSSTDYDAVLLAQFYKVEKVINLSNIKMVYDKDPNKFSKAQPIKEISWSDFRKLSTKKWTPGLKVPFDPVAAQLAEKLGLKVVVCNGKNLKNLKDILEEKEFVGTIIK